MQMFVGLALLAVLAVSGAVGAHPSIFLSTPSAAVGKVPEGLTAAEWKKMRAAIERDQYRLQPQGQAYYAPNYAQELHVTFTPEGVVVRPRNAAGQWRWGLRLRGYGYGDHLEPVSGAELVVIENRIEYRRGDLVEWYVNDHRGLEQGFTLSQRPAGQRGDAPLQLHLSPTGDLIPRLTGDGQGIEWMDEQGKTVLRYRGLYAYDAMGRALGTSMEVGKGGIRLRVKDQGAVYPITIDPFIEQKKLTASDGAAGDLFGVSVSISGDTAIIGADEDDDNGTNSGSAYIFERNQGGANNWGEVKKLTASDGAVGDFFGASVSISGDTAIVGARLGNGNTNGSGSAYIFERNQGGANNWGEVKKLAASDGAAADGFGRGVAISGDTAIVGAPFDGDNGTRSGSAYIFERNQGGADNWGEVKKLTASDGAAFDEFGGSSGRGSVAISGDTAIVGAHGDNDNGTDSGSAYIFERNQGGANNWGEVKKLTASDGAAGDRFGVGVAISGDTAIVGAFQDDDNGTDSGSAYIFERNQGGANNWGEVKKLTASDGAVGDEFGVSVSISGDTAIVGAFQDDDKGSGSGSAYIFERNQGGANNWGQVEKLTASDGAGGDMFGRSVSISGDTAIVGAHLHDDNGTNSGSAYVFGNELPALATLTVAKDGTGTGTVTGPGIDCGEDCTEAYDSDTMVTVDGVADAGSVLAAWNGCDLAVGNSCTVTMNANKTVTATFNIQQFTLTVNLAGTGSGTVTGPGINCTVDPASDCTETYNIGTMVTVNGVADAGSVLAAWNGCDLAVGNSCTVTMNADRAVTATFNLVQQFTLTASKDGTGTGTMTGPGIDCGEDCTEAYDSGTMVTVDGVADAGSVLAAWNGCDLAVGNSCTVTMNADRAVTATFDLLPTFTLMVNRDGSGTGTVTSTSPPGIINCGATCQASVNSGTTVTLSAAADTGSVFTGWSGGGCSGTGNCTVTMNSNTSMTATFKLQIFGPAMNFAVGRSPVSAAVGNLNGDGALDLVVANNGDGNVLVLLGDGTGSFVAAGNFPVGLNPASVVIGDLNGDGMLDVAVPNAGSNDVSVLLGDATGSFVAATGSPFAVGTAPSGVAIGDLNGDGVLDLAVANELTSDISILLGDGTGFFSPATPFAVGGSPVSVAIGDLNGDGALDLAVAPRGSSVAVLLGDGTGSFGTATHFPVGNGPSSVVIGDFNGDLMLDLAAANNGSNNISVVLGNGAGSFGPATDFGVGSVPVSMAIGDLNADLKLDLVVANLGSDNVSVLLNATP